VCVCARVCVCMCVCVCVCARVCMCVHFILTFEIKYLMLKITVDTTECVCTRFVQ